MFKLLLKSILPLSFVASPAIAITTNNQTSSNSIVNMKDINECYFINYSHIHKTLNFFPSYKSIYVGDEQSYLDILYFISQHSDIKLLANNSKDNFNAKTVTKIEYDFFILNGELNNCITKFYFNNQSKENLGEIYYFSIPSSVQNFVIDWYTEHTVNTNFEYSIDIE